MLSLTETIVGFAAIMLMLSLLVKSLTSLLKNHFDYYFRNLQHEVNELVRSTLGAIWPRVQDAYSAWAGAAPWKGLGDEFLTKESLKALLGQIGVTDAEITAIEGRLEGLLTVHLANVKYFFEMRMKNLSLAAGLALCLAMNINAFSIWKGLYIDEKLRASFADSYARTALEQAAAQAKEETGKSPSQTAQPSKEQEEKKLEEQRKAFRDRMENVLKDINFGVGRIWEEGSLKAIQSKSWNEQLRFFLLEFFGSLLTGLLVSIGAPYWHDLLQAISALNPSKAGK